MIIGLSQPRTSASFVPGSDQVGYLLNALPFPISENVEPSTLLPGSLSSGLIGIRGRLEPEPLLLDFVGQNLISSVQDRD